MKLFGLRGKLTLAFGVMTVLTILCAATAIYSAQRSTSLVTQVETTTLPSLRIAERLARQSERVIAQIANLPTVKSEDERQRLRGEWQKIDQALSEALEALRSLERPPADVGRLSEQIGRVRAVRTRLDAAAGHNLGMRLLQEKQREGLLEVSQAFQDILEPLIAIAEREAMSQETLINQEAQLIGNRAAIEPAAGPVAVDGLAMLLQLRNATGEIVDALLAIDQESRQEHLHLAEIRARAHADRVHARLGSLEPDVGLYLAGLTQQIKSFGIGPSGLTDLRRKIIAGQSEMVRLKASASALVEDLRRSIDGLIADSSRAFETDQNRFRTAQLQMALLVLAAAITSILASLGIGGFFMQRRVVDPIVNLSRAIEAFERGQPIAHDLREGKDEVGDLGRAFADMARSRKQAESELKERNQLLAVANAELARSNQELDSFAYIAAHDLKEPLRGIRNHATFLTQDYHDRLDEAGNKRLSRVIDLCQRLEKLMADLLFYAKLGRGDQASETIDLHDLIDEIDASLADTLKERNARIIVDDSIPAISGNRAQIATVFRNLISNGTKYSDAEERFVEIGLAKAAKEGSDNRVTISVRDNGIGIDQGFKDDVFKIFKRLNSEKAYGEGTGAGLSFVKKIIENQGGKIWFESELGQGTTFFFTLKAAA